MSTSLTPVVLLDQDGPLADFDSAIARVLRSLGCDPDLLVRTVWDTSRDIENCFGADIAEAVQDEVHEPGFYAALPVVSGAKEGVERLQQAGCEVFICTAPKLANPSCASEKLAWVSRHLPALRRRVVMTKDKTLVSGHVLVDDKPVIDGLLVPAWQHILFTTPGNAHARTAFSLGSWDDVDWLVDHARALAARQG